MEKKNTILLTVIAIATLLVAVVGATFAYFTAQVTPVDDEAKRTTTVKTYVLPSAKMTMGDEITSADLYPGGKIARSLVINGECTADSCESVKATIEVTASKISAFKTGEQQDVEWKLYKSNGTAISCTNAPTVSADGKYTSTPTCTGLDSYTSETPALTSDTDGTLTKDITVDANTNDTYYLVLEYKDNGDQNAQQGLDFNVVMDFYATGTKTTTESGS